MAVKASPSHNLVNSIDIALRPYPLVCGLALQFMCWNWEGGPPCWHIADIVLQFSQISFSIQRLGFLSPAQVLAGSSKFTKYLLS